MAKEIIQRHLEVRTHVHNGIRVKVQIDYDNGTISLIESGREAKKWVFAHRQVEYMQGWHDILDAMKHAITCAENSLRVHQIGVEKEKARMMVMIAKGDK